MVAFVIGLIIVVVGIIFAIKTKDPYGLIPFLVIIAFEYLVYCAITPYTNYEQTFTITSLNKENYYEEKRSSNGMFRTDITVCVVDDDDISHVETLTCDNLRIEYSSQAADGQMTIKYNLPESEENHIPLTLDIITLRLPESAKK